MTTPKKEQSQNSLGGSATAYLLIYNALQAVGWTWIFSVAVMHLSKNSYNSLYNEIKTSLCVFQTAAILEVIHAAVGLVRSNPVLTGFQVASRVFVTWHVWLIPEVQTSLGVSLFLLAWCITEMVRYSYYAFALFNQVPSFLQWLRYTLFIILYPVGVTGELMCVYQSLSPVARTGVLSVTLPNPANMSFNYHYMLLAIMATYIPVFPQLYGHMFKQRAKMVGLPDQKKSA